MKDKQNICQKCNMPIAIRNPSGHCDHLYYPENIKKDKQELDIEWKSIPRYENWYSVSNTGLIRRDIRGNSTYPGRIIKPIKSETCKYYRIKLCKKGSYKRIMVHLLVAEVFIGRKTKGHEVNHKDGNKLNNHINNLEYLTMLENRRHAWRMGLFDKVMLKGNDRTFAQKNKWR